MHLGEYIRLKHVQLRHSPLAAGYVPFSENALKISTFYAKPATRVIFYSRSSI